LAGGCVCCKLVSLAAKSLAGSRGGSSLTSYRKREARTTQEYLHYLAAPRKHCHSDSSARHLCSIRFLWILHYNTKAFICSLPSPDYEMKTLRTNKVIFWMPLALSAHRPVVQNALGNKTTQPRSSATYARSALPEHTICVPTFEHIQISGRFSLPAEYVVQDFVGITISGVTKVSMRARRPMTSRLRIRTVIVRPTHIVVFPPDIRFKPWNRATSRRTAVWQMRSSSRGK
jgi:hypothetical protein